MAISLTTPRYPEVRFKVSPLCYVCKSYPQYQVAVKLLGSFRLTAGNRHLHRYCIFTEQIPETVLQSLYHSCTSELTRQGISLFVPFSRRTISSSVKNRCTAFGLWGISNKFETSLLIVCKLQTYQHIAMSWTCNTSLYYEAALNDYNDYVFNCLSFTLTVPVLVRTIKLFAQP